MTTSRSRGFFWLALATLALTIIYAFGHVWLVTISELGATETFAVSLLIAAELFLMFHGLVYFSNVARVNAARSSDRTDEDPPLVSAPPVAFAMCSYREPLRVIEANLICFRNLSYPAAQLYLLDDTRYDQPGLAGEDLIAYRAAVEELCRRHGVGLFRHQWRGAKAGLINDFVRFLVAGDQPGFEFRDFQPSSGRTRATYLAIFDIDMNPLPDFAESLVARLEADERLAFIQTPQFYSNTHENRVAHGAALQQSVFYEFICEGKGLQNAMPCCGTNVIFRIAALEDVGGMDESSVTEDFATSLRLHLRGWRSRYVKRVSAFGMGPQDLGAFFRQQFRWASGMVGLLPHLLAEFVRNPRALPPSKWCEYLASVSYYCVGWIWLVIWAFPVLFVFFGFPRGLARPDVFFALFVPYFLVTMGVFVTSLGHRGYRVGEVFAGLTMNTISFPVYMRASACGLLGIRGHFKVTSKEGGAHSLALHRLWPQLAAFLVAVITFVWGINHVIYGTRPAAAVAANLFWCAYNGAMISTILFFNRPVGTFAGPIRHGRALEEAEREAD